jgi:hypothetical protein
MRGVTTVTTIDGWEIRTTTIPGREVVRLTAISPDRQRVVKDDKFIPERLATLDPAALWGRR